MLEEILDFRNITKAHKQVVSNKGAAGVDGMQTDELRDFLNTAWPRLKSDILQGCYKPHPVLKVEIPKAGGGKRMLGIPTVIDRVIQQAISQWLSPKYDSSFSKNSYGFRKAHSAHQAVVQAREYLNAGKVWVVELDLEKFFDRVNHDKLISLLSRRISDKRVLGLLRTYLGNGIMEGGVVSPRLSGTPQGSPLSPLLSNILLHELDTVLEMRGHSFIRYADDCSIYVSSRKAAERVMSKVTVYIEQELKLKVNKEKTKVSYGAASELLGFSFYRRKGGWITRISTTAVKRMKAKVRGLTMRKSTQPLNEIINKLQTVIRGWVEYFRLGQAKSIMIRLDALVQTRLRMRIWKQWKHPGARQKNLIKLGVGKKQARMWSNSNKGYCRMANSKVLLTTLNRDYFLRRGYIGFHNYYYWKTTHQTKLF